MLMRALAARSFVRGLEIRLKARSVNTAFVSFYAYITRTVVARLASYLKI